MTDKPVFHVYTLKPVEQAALRLLLKNYLKHLLKFEIESCGSDPNGIEYTEAQKKAKQAVKLIDIYDYMTQLLASNGTLGRSKTMFMTVNKTSMKYILKAIQRYEDDSKKLMDQTQDDTYIMDRAYDSMKKTLTDSSNHEYTEDEIKRAKGK